MQIIGMDSQGNAIAIQHGLTRSTLYRGRPKRRGLHDLGEGGSSGGGGFDWSALLTGLNPIIQGVGARIAGHSQGVVPIQGQVPISASGPGFFGSIDPTMLMLLGGGALLLIVMMRR